MIFSFLPLSLPLLGTLLLKCYCPHPAPIKASQDRLPHFIGPMSYLRIIRPPVQVLGFNKNGSSANVLGQGGCSFGVWVCGYLAVKKRECQRMTSRAAHTAPFPDPIVTIKRTSSKQVVLEALFYLPSNSICVSRRRRVGASHFGLIGTITP